MKNYKRGDRIFEYESWSQDRSLKITTEEKNDKWETRVFFDSMICTEIKHKESLLKILPIEKKNRSSNKRFYSGN